MAAEWNGLALQNEFASELSDVSTTSKARILQWINDIQREIVSLGDFDFNMKEGRKLLTPSVKIQSLDLSIPSAPSVAAANGGSLTAVTAYRFLITFYESVSGQESLAGVISSSVSTTATDKTINLTNIALSLDPLVTHRKIYISKGTELFYYHSSIANNTSTTASITADTTSLIEPPEFSQIRATVGDLTILNQGRIEYRSQSQIRELFSQYSDTGSPQCWASMGGNSILVYPAPLTAQTCVFFYQKVPARLYASIDSVPEIPITLKELLRAGVMARGYLYSDRDGKIERMNIYKSMSDDYKSKLSYNASGVFRVRDTRGRSTGREV